MELSSEGLERMTSIRGKLPEPGERAEQILEDPELYFAEARKRNRAAIVEELKNRRSAKSRRTPRSVA